MRVTTMTGRAVARARIAPGALAADRSTRRRATTARLALALCAATALPVHAAGYDPATDRVSLEGATLAIDFENPARIPADVYDTASNRLDPHTAEDGPHAIEGARSLRVEGAARLVAIELDPVREALIGRRIEIRLWQRPLGTRLTGDLRWTVDHVDLGALTIQPTGRTTTDGWEEWTTGPVDFAIDGLTPQRLLLYDEQYFTSFVDLDRSVSVALDAITVLDLGPARVPTAACRITTEADVCGDHGACIFGRCADAAAVLGQPLLDARLRVQAHDRRAFEARTFEGNRRARALAPGFAAILGWIGDPRTTVRDYWTTLRTAYDGLGDGRATAPIAGSRPDVGGGACAYDGDADLLPDRPLLPLIFETTIGHALADRVRAGDAIRSIDGLAPHVWAARASRLLAYGGDPTARQTQLIPQLLNAAMVSGAVLAIERCTLTGRGEVVPCAPREVQHFTVDLAALVAPMLEDGSLAPIRRRTICDFRFRRPVREDRNGRVPEYAGYIDEPSGVRALQINGVPGDPRWLDLVDRALDAPLDKVLLDQRQGTGGALGSTALLVGRLTDARDLAAIELWPPMEPTPAIRAALRACKTADPSGDCAGFTTTTLDDDPLSGEVAGARLAILDGTDVAGNDAVARALAMRRHGGATRIFGPSATYGAFGGVGELSRLPGEVASVSMQTHDAVFLAPGDEGFDFASGLGVVPSVVVRQKQSDALRGVDTVLEAARAWLVEE